MSGRRLRVLLCACLTRSVCRCLIRACMRHCSHCDHVHPMRGAVCTYVTACPITPNPPASCPCVRSRTDLRRRLGMGGGMTQPATEEGPPGLSSSDSATVPRSTTPPRSPALQVVNVQVSGGESVLQGGRHECTGMSAGGWGPASLTTPSARPSSAALARPKYVFASSRSAALPGGPRRWRLHAIRPPGGPTPSPPLPSAVTLPPSPFGRRRGVSEVTGFLLSGIKII